MSEPKPMDPKRLAQLREHVGQTQRATFPKHEVVELLAAYDYTRVDLEIACKLRRDVIDERDAARRKLAEHGVARDDDDVRRHLDLLGGLESSVEEHQLKQCENELAMVLRLSDHDGWHRLLDAVKRLRADVDRLRAGCGPNVDDVLRAGVTTALRDAWLLARAEPKPGPTGGRISWEREQIGPIAETWGDTKDDGTQRGITARAICSAAYALQLSPWDVLDQMSAIGMAALAESAGAA